MAQILIRQNICEMKDAPFSNGQICFLLLTTNCNKFKWIRKDAIHTNTIKHSQMFRDFFARAVKTPNATFEDYEKTLSRTTATIQRRLITVTLSDENTIFLEKDLKRLAYFKSYLERWQNESNCTIEINIDTKLTPNNFTMQDIELLIDSVKLGYLSYDIPVTKEAFLTLDHADDYLNEHRFVTVEAIKTYFCNRIPRVSKAITDELSNNDCHPKLQEGLKEFNKIYSTIELFKNNEKKFGDKDSIQYKVFFGKELSAHLLIKELKFSIQKTHEKIYISICYNSLQYLHLLKLLSSTDIVELLEVKNKVISQLIENTVFKCTWKTHRNSERKFLELYCSQLLNSDASTLDISKQELMKNTFKVLWKLKNECRLHSYLKYIKNIKFTKIFSIKNLEILFLFMLQEMCKWDEYFAETGKISHIFFQNYKETEVDKLMKVFLKNMNTKWLINNFNIWFLIWHFNKLNNKVLIRRFMYIR